MEGSADTTRSMVGAISPAVRAGAASGPAVEVAPLHRRHRRPAVAKMLSRGYASRRGAWRVRRRERRRAVSLAKLVQAESAMALPRRPCKLTELAAVEGVADDSLLGPPNPSARRLPCEIRVSRARPEFEAWCRTLSYLCANLSRKEEDLVTAAATSSFDTVTNVWRAGRSKPARLTRPPVRAG